MWRNQKTKWDIVIIVGSLLLLLVGAILLILFNPSYDFAWMDGKTQEQIQERYGTFDYYRRDPALGVPTSTRAYRSFLGFGYALYFNDGVMVRWNFVFLNDPAEWSLYDAERYDSSREFPSS